MKYIILFFCRPYLQHRTCILSNFSATTHNWLVPTHRWLVITSNWATKTLIKDITRFRSGISCDVACCCALCSLVVALVNYSILVLIYFMFSITLFLEADLYLIMVILTKDGFFFILFFLFCIILLWFF
jgi:hypothetical protein